MAYDVARVRGLHPSLGDGWVHLDAPAGMLIPDSVATTVSTAFRRSSASMMGAHPSAQRSAAVLDAARTAVADLFNADPAGVVLGADRAILLSSLAEASSSRAGLGYELIVSRLDDEANIAPWLRAAHRYGAKVQWAEVDIETGDLPTWQWESLIGKPTRLVAVTSASGTLGTVTDLRAMTKLVHEVGGLVIVDHSAAAPYRLLDVEESDVDVVAVNANAWGGPPDRCVGVPRSVPDGLVQLGLDGSARHRPGALEVGGHQFGLLGRCGCQHRIPGRARRVGARQQTRTPRRVDAIGGFLSEPLFDYLMVSLRSLPLVMLIGRPETRIPVISFALHGVPAERVVQRLADNGILAISDAAFTRAGCDRRQRRRRRGYRRAGALLDDGRGRPAGPRPGLAGLS